MNNHQQGMVTRGLASVAAELNPLKSMTFLLALGLIAVAAYKWLREPEGSQSSFPFYGTIAGSYAGGFLIGRLFWRIVKTAAIVAAIVIGGLTVLNRVHVNTSKAKEAAEAGSTWVRNEASRAKHFLLHFLPSGVGAGLGVFAGSRRPRGLSQSRNSEK
jgi:hypothetical protein